VARRTRNMDGAGEDKGNTAINEVEEGHKLLHKHRLVVFR
jgi:hypothetical protein